MTNKGVPVCFFITNREVSTVIAEWLNWVKENVAVRPRRIMIDCSAAEIEAIRQAFQGEVSVLLCHWHIKRAWEKHIKTDVSEDIFTFYIGSNGSFQLGKSAKRNSRVSKGKKQCSSSSQQSYAC